MTEILDSFDEYDPKDLPESVTTYLQALPQQDYDTALSVFDDEATVDDNGELVVGLEEISSWLERSAPPRSRPVGQSVTDDEHVSVLVHVEGDYPGGEAEINYDFTLADDMISALEIRT